MLKSYIFGTSSLAKVLAYYLAEEGKKLDGFVLNENFIKTDDRNKYSLPLFSIEEVIKEFGSKNIEVYVAIGYSNMNKDRETIFKWLHDNKIKICTYIHPSAVVAKNALLGAGNLIFENCVVQPFVTIGDGNIFWNNSTVSHESIVGSYNHISAGTTIAGRVTIKNRCFIGINSAIKNDVVIGNEVLIVAGSYVACSLDDNYAFIPVKGKSLRGASESLGLFL